MIFASKQSSLTILRNCDHSPYFEKLICSLHHSAVLSCIRSDNSVPIIIEGQGTKCDLVLDLQIQEEC